MNVTYLLQAIRDEVHVVNRGTAWFLDPETVVTAFHVVGDPQSGEWLSDQLTALEYRLLTRDEPIILQPLPLGVDEAADIALLKPVDQARLIGSVNEALEKQGEYLETSGHQRHLEELLVHQSKALENKIREVRALNRMFLEIQSGKVWPLGSAGAARQQPESTSAA